MESALSRRESAGPAAFAIVGSGWRAEFYLRIARALSDRFRVCGVVTRREERRREIAAEWGVAAFADVDALLAECSPEFVVVSVKREAAAGIVRMLTDRGTAVLAETPPAATLGDLAGLAERVRRGARIQVAEQFHLQPFHAAGLALARSGRLGEIGEAQVSVNHSYHSISLMRRYLGIGFENAEVIAREFSSPRVAGPGRQGLPEREIVADARQVIALFHFGEKLGLFDYEENQHRSYVRSRRVLVRGSRGEINNLEVRCLEDFRTPIELSLRRLNAGEDGNVEGYYLKGILAGDEWLYRNPYAPASLSDEEIAVASCLTRMADYAAGGEEFYSVAEAAQDCYLWSAVEESLRRGEAVATENQQWR